MALGFNSFYVALRLKLVDFPLKPFHHTFPNSKSLTRDHNAEPKTLDSPPSEASAIC